jgi:hypothetical protein
MSCSRVAPPVATARSATADATIALALSERPAGAHLYEDPAEVRREFEEGGYYERPPHRPTGRWVAFRFPAVTRRAAFAAERTQIISERRFGGTTVVALLPAAEPPVACHTTRPPSRPRRSTERHSISGGRSSATMVQVEPVWI